MVIKISRSSQYCRNSGQIFECEVQGILIEITLIEITVIEIKNILICSTELAIIEITTIGISGNRTIGGRNTEMSPSKFLLLSHPILLFPWKLLNGFPSLFSHRATEFYLCSWQLKSFGIKLQKLMNIRTKFSHLRLFSRFIQVEFMNKKLPITVKVKLGWKEQPLERRKVHWVFLFWKSVFVCKL